MSDRHHHNDDYEQLPDIIEVLFAATATNEGFTPGDGRATGSYERLNEAIENIATEDGMETLEKVRELRAVLKVFKASGDSIGVAVIEDQS